MKKILCSLLLLSGNAAIVHAQATLTAATMNPVVYDAFTTITCDTTGVLQGPAGAAVTWDFTGLITDHTDTGYAALCSATPNCAMFPGTTIAVKALTGSTATYAIATSTKYSQNGYYFSSTQNATFSDPLDQLHYPMTYLDSFTDTYAGVITYTNGITIVANESGTAKVVCDGYGTLKLPTGIETNVVRTHSTQLFADSALVFGTPTVVNFLLNTYTWYTPNYHSPLMTILVSDQVGGGIHTKIVTYGKRYPLSVGSLNEVANSLELYPNPAVNNLNIHFTQANSENINITLVDLLGREVAVIADKAAQGNVDINYNTAHLPRGMYIVRVQTGKETVSRKLELQ